MMTNINIAFIWRKKTTTRRQPDGETMKSLIVITVDVVIIIFASLLVPETVLSWNAPYFVQLWTCNSGGFGKTILLYPFQMVAFLDFAFKNWIFQSENHRFLSCVSVSHSVCERATFFRSEKFNFRWLISSVKIQKNYSRFVIVSVWFYCA